MGKHRAIETTVETREEWGIKMPDGRILREGYSCRTLVSAEDVRKDFSAEVLAAGEVILLTQVTKTRKAYVDELA